MTPKQRFTAALRKPVQEWSVTALIGAVVGVLTITGFAAAGARAAHNSVNNIETKPHAESLFVRRDSFAAYQAGVSRRMSVDSVAREARDARMDATLSALYRACQHKGECP